MAKRKTESSPSNTPPRVFVVYGRNLRAYKEVQKYLAYIGVDEISFEEVANREAAPFVTNVVLSGIASADAVIVLFTPDELSVLFEASPEAGMHNMTPRDYRWQARPNVTFEAGVAFGTRQRETVIVSIGRDVQGFSDISGIHLVNLGSSSGKEALRSRLAAILKLKLKHLPNGWTTDKVKSGDFEGCVSPRWPFFDELGWLERFLSSRALFPASPAKKRAGRFRKVFSLYEVLLSVAANGDWESLDPYNLIEAIKQSFDDEIADQSYWWLCVAGVLQFQDADQWWESDEHWEGSVDFTKFSPRGLALLEKMRITNASK